MDFSKHARRLAARLASFVSLEVAHIVVDIAEVDVVSISLRR